MFEYRRIDDLGPLKGKRVLLRADLNLQDSDGKVSDDTRARAIAPTVRDLRQRGARIVICSHFGRPGGKPDKAYSLASIMAAVEKSIGERMVFCQAWKGRDAKNAIEGASVPVLLENLRFDPGEEANDPALAADLAELADVYINDALSVCHRAHASTEGVARLLPAAAGHALAREIDAIQTALEKPKRPVAAIVGGAKVSTKLAVLENLIQRVDHLIIGGAMANTFLAANKVDVGASLHEPDLLETARMIIRKAKARDCLIHLPVDAAVAVKLEVQPRYRTIRLDNIRPDEMILDLGSASVKKLIEVVSKCKTVLWNGPLGAFEYPPFDEATNALAAVVARMTANGKIISIAGGGDTVAALSNTRARRDFTFVSTAGGAFLEWLEGRKLPGLAVLAK